MKMTPSLTPEGWVWNQAMIIAVAESLLLKVMLF